MQHSMISDDLEALRKDDYTEKKIIMIKMVKEHKSISIRCYIPQHCCIPRAYELHNPQPATRKPYMNN